MFYNHIITKEKSMLICDTQKISMHERQALITVLPCFSTLSAQESQKLAECMTEVRYRVGEKIVEEDALVDNIYILVTGSAEVSRLVAKKTKKIKIPLAILDPGEAIGLNETGFFSSTGKRTATVTALSDVLLLRLDLKTLHHFLEQHSHLQSTMYASAEQMLRTLFIKQSLPFSHLSHERLTSLADKITSHHFNQGDIIFNEGDAGDCCYLVRSGQIEILTKNLDGSEHQLAILKASTLFGEATLITDAPRNATARALVDSELFELKHEYLSELIESEKNVADTFMTLMIDRSRPLQNPRVTAHPRSTADEQQVVILKNPDNGSYFKLSEEGWFVWKQMNGQYTMQEITMQLSDQYNVFAPDVVAALISKLAKAGFVTHVDINDVITSSTKQSVWVRAMLRTRRILESRLVIGDADHWLTALYQNAAFLLFSSIGRVLLLLIIFLGVCAFGFSTPHIILLFKTIQDSWILFICLIPFTLLSVALHELGHALATKYYGHEVHYMGIGWYWLSPIAFTDTSDMWLSTRRGARIFVNLAGIYADVVVAGIASLLIYIIPNLYVQAFLWLFALFTYISAFRMLNPLQELDGYYVLVDIFDRPRLRQRAVLWLVKRFSSKKHEPKLHGNSVPEIIYWICCIVFLILISLITLFVQGFLLKILNIQPTHPIISLILPIIVGLISCLGIIADIRNQAD
jgi:CRP-like cAMP-binding protein